MWSNGVVERYIHGEAHGGVMELWSVTSMEKAMVELWSCGVMEKATTTPVLQYSNSFSLQYSSFSFPNTPILFHSTTPLLHLSDFSSCLWPLGYPSCGAPPAVTPWRDIY